MGNMTEASNENNVQVSICTVGRDAEKARLSKLSRNVGVCAGCKVSGGEEGVVMISRSSGWVIDCNKGLGVSTLAVDHGR